MSKILLHIGFPKAGSSFLGDWFHKHPDIIFRDFSIGGFYNTQQLMDAAINKEAEIDKIRIVRDMRFTAPGSEDFKNIKDIETAQTNIANTLVSLFPNAKVLIVTRGFEAAIKANYSQNIKEGGILSFNKFIDIHKNSKWLPFNYSYVIDLYIKLFGKENILILPYERLNKEPDLFIKKIESFLTINHFNYINKVINPSLTSKSIEFIRKLNKSIYFFLFIYGPFQKFAYKLYRKFISRFKTKSWNNIFIKTLAIPFGSNNTKYSIPEEIQNRFSDFSLCLKNNPEYSEFKNEYFIK